MLERSSRSSVQVPFGLKDGRLFEPLQVERGLLCNCICPGCSAALIAKHAPSGKVTPHFSHASGAACATGLESALHLAAKQLINDRRELYLPALVASARSQAIGHNHLHRQETVHQGVLASLEGVRVEESIGHIRPDLIVNMANQEILVEIAYTSFVTPEKLEKIRLHGVAAVEVDISDLAVLDFDALALRLFEPTPHSKWIFHPDLAAREAALNLLLAEDIVRDRIKKEEQKKQRLARIEAEEARILYARILEVTQAKAKAAPFRVLSNTQKLSMALDKLGPQAAALSTVLPIRARGASAIDAAPRVWQTSVFSALIHPALRRNAATLSSDQVQRWLRDRFTVDTTSSSAAVAVWDYLVGLAELNILHKQSKQDFLVVVPDIYGALEVAADAKERGARNQCWSSEWPSPKKAQAVAEVFSAAYGNRLSWGRVAGLLPSVRDLESPLSAMAHYSRYGQGSLSLGELRRFFLSTGFTHVPR